MTNYTLKIISDETTESPRTSCDNLGTLTAWHSRYNLSDENAEYNDFRDFLEYHTEDKYEDQDEFYEAADEHLLSLMKEDYFILPVYMYEHSNVVLRTESFNDSWDSGQIGFVYVSNEKIIDEYGDINENTLEIVERVLKSEIDVYSKYINGETYGFELVDNETDETIDSCWGFIGTDIEENGILEHISLNESEFEVEYEG